MERTTLQEKASDDPFGIRSQISGKRPAFLTHSHSSQSSHNEFYRELCPVITVLRVAGVFPIYIQSDVVRFRMLSVAMLHAVCVYIAEFLLLWFTMVLRLYRIVDKYDFFDLSLFVFLAASYFLFVLFIPVFNWTEAGKVADYINSWKHFQVEYSKVTGQMMILSLRRKAFVMTFVIAILLILFELVYQLVNEDDVLIDFPVALKEFYLDFVRFFLPAFWYLACASLSKAAHGLAQHFKAEMATSPTPAAVLRSYRGLWLCLSRLARKTGTATCYTYGFYILYLFLTLTLFVYHTICNLTHGFRVDMLLMTLECFVMAGVLFVVCNSADMATFKIGDTIIDDLLNLRMSARNFEVVEEVDVFLNTVRARKPEIELGGFVTVDRRLYMSLGSMMVTYLVVLLQFNLTSDSNGLGYNVPLEI